jgi:hypothetical protein
MRNIKNNHSMTDDLNYLLYNVSNYKKCIDNSIQDIVATFVSIIIEYMRFITEKITMKNKTYYRFILKRGLECLIHTFSLVFYYTKNLELTFYHSQKAYYFYIEFIEQISDDNINFLQLSSRDAILFVYKKTIYDLNSEYRKNISDPTNEEKSILVTLDCYFSIYKNMVEFVIYHKDFNYDNKIEYINLNCNRMKEVSDLLIKNKEKKHITDCIHSFINLLSDKEMDVESFFNTLKLFIKKINQKKKIDEIIIKNRIHESEIHTFISNNEIDEVMEWIFL